MLRRNKQLVGKDILGNLYYNSLTKTGEKRWVIYNGQADPTKIPALWHIWLHYTDNQLPKLQEKNLHVPNLTGTKHAYHPKNFF